MTWVEAVAYSLEGILITRPNMVNSLRDLGENRGRTNQKGSLSLSHSLSLCGEVMLLSL